MSFDSTGSGVDLDLENDRLRKHERALGQGVGTNGCEHHDTAPGQLHKGIEIIREILADHEGMDPERPPLAFFNEFNDVSLNIIAIYWYHNPDFVAYLKFTDKINFAILERFNAEGIEFAFPTQTVFLANDDKRQLAVKVLDGNPSAMGAG